MKRFHFLKREPFLLAALVLVIAAFFAATSFAAHLYHLKQERFAEMWYEQGEEALKQGRPEPAVEDFRNALAYSRDNDLYRLRLAQALLADHRPKEARAHLLSLWEKEPADGTINLELARMAAMWGDTPHAIRYYHAAIYGVWPDDPTPHRIDARFELSEYLLKHDRSADSQAELVALAANLPRDDAAAQVRLGYLLSQAGLNARALTAFRTALEDSPNLLAALAGAGEAAFGMGEYPTARHYLLPVAAQAPQNTHAMELLNLSELIMKFDPYVRSLPARERARRAVHDFDLVLARAQKCSSSDRPAPAIVNLTPLVQQAMSLKPTVRENLLARSPDMLEKTMDIVFKLEDAMGRQCTPSTLEDKALALLVQKKELLQ